MTTGGDSGLSFAAWLEALDAKLAREQRSMSPHEWAETVARLEEAAAERRELLEHPERLIQSHAGVLSAFYPPELPSLEWLEANYAPVDELAEPVEERPTVAKDQPGPDPTLHPSETIGDALEEIVAGGRGAKARAAKESGLDPKDVKRVELLWRGGLLRVRSGPDGLTFRATRRIWIENEQIALRYRSADGTRWLDPFKHPPPPVRAGS